MFLSTAEIAKRQEPLSRSEWEDRLDAEGYVKDCASIKKRIAEGVGLPKIMLLILVGNS